MILGILSDTHLTRPLPELEYLLNGPLKSAEVILHAGDHDREEVIDYLEFDEPRPYHGVAGNMDTMASSRRLGQRKILELGGLKIGLLHGWGPGEGLENRVHTAFGVAPDIIVFGHSHIPLIKRIGPTLFLNPGSPFSPRTLSRGTVMLLTIEEGVATPRLIEV